MEKLNICLKCQSIPKIKFLPKERGILQYLCKCNLNFTIPIQPYISKLPDFSKKIRRKLKLGPIFSQIEICKKHPNRKYKYYCETCDEHFCEHCDFEDHNEHKIHIVSDLICLHDLRNKGAHGDVITKDEYKIVSKYKNL